MPGRSVVAEFGTKFDADLAHARLTEAGLESMVLGDPAHSIAPHLVTDRVFQLVVRDEIADHAREVLSDGLPPDVEADELDQVFHHRRFADRPAWIRWMTWAAAAAFVAPVALTAFLEVVFLADRLFP